MLLTACRPAPSPPPSWPATPSFSNPPRKPSSAPGGSPTTSGKPASRATCSSFSPTPENYVGRRLIAHPAVSAILLTGTHQTARAFLGLRPGIRLLAATSAKNALVITAAADLDQAVADLVDSAFAHSGQHPAAASLAIVEAAVYDNPVFREKLKDATASLKAAAAWTPGAAITPLIRPPSQELHRAQLTLDPGEEWLLQPKRLGQNPALWSAGIKLGIQPGSWFHLNECPGPLLGIIRADNLDHAIRLQNDTPFGLTGGIHSLDPAEVYRWLTTAELGNACVNRPLAGPAARRHPFGGWKFSAFGPIRKIGGPNFTASLARWQQLDLPAHTSTLRPDIADILQTIKRWLKVDLEKQVAEAAARSYQHFMDTEFGVEHDPSALPGQANIFRYLPLPRGILLRLRDPFEPLHLAGCRPGRPHHQGLHRTQPPAPVVLRRRPRPALHHRVRRQFRPAPRQGRRPLRPAARPHGRQLRRASSRHPPPPRRR